ncbi:MAG: hypothetical protein IT232_06230 [Flavobacteriales bacterium]|jgi:hypothetical protein|nr:hypothetical protein [Flavobacteriales bacterium]
MIKQFFLILIIGLSLNIKAQIALNPGLDTSSVIQKEIFNFWSNYLKSKPAKNTTDYLDFWDKSEREKFKQPDLTLHAINTEHSIFSQGYITILSILPIENNYYQIKTAIGWGDSTNHAYLLAITNHFVKRTVNGYKLFSPLTVFSNKLNIIETDDYRIYTSKNTLIPKDTLDNLTNFILKLKSDYQIKENKKITIIYGKNKNETEAILGFDFDCMAATNNPVSGISDLSNNLIILNGLSPIFHEITHIYLNPLYKETPLLEGLATFYGGSLGKSLQKGINFLNKYSSQNSRIDLYEKLEDSYFHIDNEYNPIYTLQGLLIKLAYEKEGINGVKKILTFGSFEEIFIQYFHLQKKSEFNNFIKEELKKNSR